MLYTIEIQKQYETLNSFLRVCSSSNCRGLEMHNTRLHVFLNKQNKTLNLPKGPN